MAVRWDTFKWPAIAFQPTRRSAPCSPGPVSTMTNIKGDERRPCQELPSVVVQPGDDSCRLHSSRALLRSRRSVVPPPIRSHVRELKETSPMRTALTVGLLLGLTALAGAAPGTDPSPQPAANRRLVTLRVHDEGSWTVVVSVAIGNAATVARPGMPMLRISPAVSPDDLLSLTASLVSTSSDATSANTDVSDVGPITFGSTARLELGNYRLDVTWTDDKTIADTATAFDDGASECCVVCEGIKTCACRVQAPCGGCCDQACGGCGQTGSQTGCAAVSVLSPRAGAGSPTQGPNWGTAGSSKSPRRRTRR